MDLVVSGHGSPTVEVIEDVFGAVPTGLRAVDLYSFPTLKRGARIQCAYGAGFDARLQECG